MNYLMMARNLPGLAHVARAVARCVRSHANTLLLEQMVEFLQGKLRWPISLRSTRAWPDEVHPMIAAHECARL